ncbi:hypothetical protein B0H63DRAFT_484237 [Podospora didyma]|uniref:Heterokaryon incompatibility domain-containing protein n=1 Tax=Podospora didyma TaxID=330526 RepID=A0AAE0K9T8_9PEZI|nr:hypothetical protein B0H63DRAFT_484237 [Podospora didyma]
MGIENFPKRLLEVGKVGASRVRLCNMLWLREYGSAHELGFDLPRIRYAAVSHSWGNSGTMPAFCTNVKNHRSLESGIPDTDLPITFQHAVTAARALGFEYLWIDALYIMHGPCGDFATQGPLIGDIFQPADVVFAATRSFFKSGGFLRDRRSDRMVVTFSRRPGVRFYAREHIDDFMIDVAKMRLHQMAWTQQERCLARRTVYFGENQTYWECGKGI